MLPLKQRPQLLLLDVGPTTTPAHQAPTRSVVARPPRISSSLCLCRRQLRRRKRQHRQLPLRLVGRRKPFLVVARPHLLRTIISLSLRLVPIRRTTGTPNRLRWSPVALPCLVRILVLQNSSVPAKCLGTGSCTTRIVNFGTTQATGTPTTAPMVRREIATGRSACICCSVLLSAALLSIPASMSNSLRPRTAMSSASRPSAASRPCPSTPLRALPSQIRFVYSSWRPREKRQL
mmetsp:Transcript_29041/g.84405  ORF Transcript_29041/g.84405 Transcript_29041/m.84405 type:complete len:234 (-) Transcript_29041:182-883(-)